MKKTIALLLALMVFVPCISSTEEAKAETLFHPGDIFDASFTILSNPQNAEQILCKLKYDPSIFELLKSPAVFQNSIIVRIHEGRLESDQGNVSFKVLDHARAGIWVIGLEVIQAVDANGKIIPDAEKTLEVSQMVIEVQSKEEKQIYHPEDTVDAFFTVTENPNKAMSATLRIVYDPSVFHVITSNMIQNDTVSFVDKAGSIPIGKTQWISFQVLSTAPDGDYTISAEVTDARNENGMIVSGFTVSSFSVEVAKSELQKALETALETIDSLKGQVDLLTQEKENLSIALNTAKASLAAEQEENQNLSAQLANAQGEIEGLKAELDQAKEEAAANLEAAKTEAAKALENLKAEASVAAAEAANALQAAKAEAAAGAERNAELEKQISEYIGTVWGDINRDGVTDLSDVVALQNYLTDNDASKIDLSKCDLNSDGAIDAEDVNTLQSYVLNSFYGE